MKFRAALNRSFSVDQVSKWTRIAPLRPLVCHSYSIWGLVRWPKPLGKALGMPPLWPTPSSARSYKCIGKIGHRPLPKRHRIYFPGNPVSTWEITNSENYAVEASGIRRYPIERIGFRFVSLLMYLGNSCRARRRRPFVWSISVPRIWSRQPHKSAATVLDHFGGAPPGTLAGVVDSAELVNSRGLKSTWVQTFLSEANG